jgi:hypothetical protein
LRLPVVCREESEGDHREMLDMNCYYIDRMVAAETVCRDNNLVVPRVPNPWFPEEWQK